MEKKFKIPDYSNLKLTLKGKNDYFFLVNDGNKELHQHFDETYINKFDKEKFKKQFELKKKMLKEKNIDYFLFVVPDKSIICKKFLPFEFKTIKRNYNHIKEIAQDFSDRLTCADYYKYDTHLNYLGGENFVFNCLNHIYPSLKKEEYDELIKENETIKTERNFDLFFNNNWSYSEEEKSSYPTKGYVYTSVPKNLIDSYTTIPDKFKLCNKRKSTYDINMNSKVNKKVLIFGDSFFEFMKNYFNSYFNEVFFYWDHGNFNKELIEWYKPDLILEIRIERYIENYPYPEWVFENTKLNL